MHIYIYTYLCNFLLAVAASPLLVHLTLMVQATRLPHITTSKGTLVRVVTRCVVTEVRSPLFKCPVVKRERLGARAIQKFPIQWEPVAATN